jgi:hypothetical protein
MGSAASAAPAGKEKKSPVPATEGIFLQASASSLHPRIAEETAQATSLSTADHLIPPQLVATPNGSSKTLANGSPASALEAQRMLISNQT